MIDLIKKSLLAGVGAAAVTKEKVEQALDDFVRQGKISTADARIMAEKIAEQGRKEFDEVWEKLGAKLNEFKTGADQTAHARIAALEARLEALEKNQKHAPPSTRAGEP